MDDSLRRKSSTELVLEAVADLHAKEQLATRDTIAEVTGLKKTIVDDRLKVLVNDERIHRVRDGVFVPVVKHPPARAISHTMLPDGMCKLEVGDDVLMLTPREQRMLGVMLTGTAMQFSQIEAGHQSAVLASGINERVLRLERMASAAANEASGDRAKRDLRAIASSASAEPT
ncbi:hypothetical protein [Variovorax sp. YR216]|uniref:hypothetical protein n=1 Tax=Variovorax sp. YR216 TaxID=1882828 RepID=UPI0008989DC2|nr:hypothetical protein [Variovorax sp. YR216]SEA76454.1 hypothetical protein SAMN05444680_103481 [Variovorax sp. YR216]